MNLSKIPGIPFVLLLIAAIALPAPAQVVTGIAAAPQVTHPPKDSTASVRDSLSVMKDTVLAGKDTESVRKDTLEIISSEASPYTIPGFRVQILSTQDLKDALNAKTQAESELTNFNVYLVYDPPYYKVRVGDFRVRYEANQAATNIAGRGFPNAWTVPDNVFRNPVIRR